MAIKKYFRVFSLILVMCLCLGLFAGCGKSDDNANNSSDQPSSSDEKSSSQTQSSSSTAQSSSSKTSSTDASSSSSNASSSQASSQETSSTGVKPKVVKMLHMPSEKDEGLTPDKVAFFKKQREFVEKKYNVKLEFVKAQSTDWNAIPEEIAKSVAANKPLADIAKGARMWLPQLVKNNSVIDVTDINKDLQIATKYKELAEWQEKIYGLANSEIYADAGIIYNKDMLKKAGMSKTPGQMFKEGKWSYIDFYRYCKELKSKMGDNEFPFFIDPQYWMIYAPAANNGYIIDNSGRIRFTDDATIESLEFLQSLFNDGFVRPTNAKADGSLDYRGTISSTFDQGKEVAMTYKSFWQLNELVGKVNFGYVPFPWGPQVKVTGDYKSIPKQYRSVFYDADMVFAIKGSEKNIDTKTLYEIYVDYRGDEIKFMNDNYNLEKQGKAITYSDEGLPRCFNDELDVALFDWNAKRGMFDPTASLKPIVPAASYVRDIIHKQLPVRATLESKYKASVAAMKDAGYLK